MIKATSNLPRIWLLETYYKMITISFILTFPNMIIGIEKRFKNGIYTSAIIYAFQPPLFPYSRPAKIT